MEISIEAMQKATRERMTIEQRMSKGEFDNHPWEECATLTRFVIMSTSLVKLVINFPECLLSINWVSAFINEENISVCISFFTSTETPIIIILARYKEAPLMVNAIIINEGIK